MDRDYIIKVLIQGFDNLSGPVRNAAREVKAAVNDIKQSFSGLGGGGQQDPFGVKQMGKDADSATQKFSTLRGAANGVRDALRGVKSLAGEVHAGFRAFDADKDRLDELKRAGTDVESTLFGIGQQLGNVAQAWQGAFGNKVNIPFFPDLPLAPLIGLLGIILPLLFQLGGALIAVASAAAIAAAALGGALVAGLAGLVPLLAVILPTFLQIGDVIKALTTPTTQLAQSQHQLAAAHQSVAAASRDAVQAQKSLAQARQSAARQIVDANNAEKDSILNVQQAEIALLQARQKLRQDEKAQQQAQSDLAAQRIKVQQAQQALALAEQGGNADQIAQAQAALANAEGNLKQAQQAQTANQGQLQIRQDKLSVQQAQQRLVEARISEARAIQDANKANADGIRQAPQVLAAQRNVAQAARSYAAALNSVHQAQLQINKLPVNQLSPVQKQLYNVLKPLVGEGGILVQLENRIGGAVIKGFLGGFKTAIGRVLGDNALLNSLAKLASAFGKGLGDLLKALTSPEALAGLKYITDNVTKFTPLFFKLVASLITLFGKIAVAATPMLDTLFKSFVKWIESLSKGANIDKMMKFFDKAGTYAQAFASLALSMLHFLGAIIGVSAPAGLTAVEKLTKWFNNLATNINDPKRAGSLRKWFAQAVQDSGLFLEALVKIAGAFVKVFSDPKNAHIFAQMIAALPGILQKTFDILQLIVTIMGQILTLVNKISGGRGSGILGWTFAIGTLVLLLSPVLGIFKAIFKTVEATGKILKDIATSNAFKNLAGGVGGKLGRGGGATTAERAAKAGIILPTGVGGAEAGAEGVGAAGGIAGVETGLTATGIGAIVAAVIAVAIGMFLAIKNNFLGVRTALVGALRDLGHAFGGVWTQLRQIWKTLSGPGGLGQALHEVWKAAQELWKVLRPLVKIILELAGALVIGLLIAGLKVLTGIIQYGLVDPLKLLNSLLKILSGVIKGLEHPVRGLTDALHWFEKKLREIWDWIKGIAHDIAHPGSALKDLAKKGLDIISHPEKHIPIIGGYLPATGGDVTSGSVTMATGPRGTDTVPAWLTPGEWVLNAMQQTKVAAALFGGNLAAAKNWLFGPGGGDGVPQNAQQDSKPTVGAHAGKPGAPSHRAKRHSKGGYTYAIDQDSYGNSVTFAEAKDGTWVQVAVTPSGKTPLTPTPHGHWAKTHLYHRSKARMAVDALLAAGDYAMAAAVARHDHIPLHDYRDFGGRYAPTATPRYAAGGVVSMGVRQPVSRSVSLGGLHISGSGDAASDGDYLLRRAGLIVETMT